MWYTCVLTRRRCLSLILIHRDNKYYEAKEGGSLSLTFTNPGRGWHIWFLSHSLVSCSLPHSAWLEIVQYASAKVINDLISRYYFADSLVRSKLLCLAGVRYGDWNRNCNLVLLLLAWLSQTWQEGAMGRFNSVFLLLLLPLRPFPGLLSPPTHLPPKTPGRPHPSSDRPNPFSNPQ